MHLLFLWNFPHFPRNKQIIIYIDSILRFINFIDERKKRTQWPRFEQLGAIHRSRTSRLSASTPDSSVQLEASNTVASIVHVWTVRRQSQKTVTCMFMPRIPCLHRSCTSRLSASNRSSSRWKDSDMHLDVTNTVPPSYTDEPLVCKWHSPLCRKYSAIDRSRMKHSSTKLIDMWHSPLCTKYGASIISIWPARLKVDIEAATCGLDSTTAHWNGAHSPELKQWNRTKLLRSCI